MRSSGGRSTRDRLREPDVAGLDRQPETRDPVGDRDVAAGDQRGEQRLAGVRRGLAGRVQRPRRRERRIAVLLPAHLDRVARELDILAGRRRIEAANVVQSPRLPSDFSHSTRSRSASGVFGQRAK